MPERAPNHHPSWRKPAGIFAILAIIAIWAFVVASLDHMIGSLPILVQALIYAATGIVWILPLRPLMIWMETGRWRA